MYSISYVLYIIMSVSLVYSIVNFIKKFNVSIKLKHELSLTPTSKEGKLLNENNKSILTNLNIKYYRKGLIYLFISIYTYYVFFILTN